MTDEIKNTEIDDVKIIINSGRLDKKSKLRQNFEKQKDLVKSKNSAKCRRKIWSR